MAKIGEKIKNARTRANFSQVVLADYLNVDQSMISKIEKGEREINTSMLKKLSELFCCPIDYFISDDAGQSTVSMAFHTNAMGADDLRIIANINRIALNLEEMDLIGSR